MFFNLRCEFLSHIQLIEIDKQIFVFFFCFVLFVFFLISCVLVSDERFILLKWMLRRSLLHSFALDVFLLLRRQVVIKSIMFWQEPTKSNLMGSWFWLRVTRPHYLVFICFVFLPFSVLLLLLFFFFFFKDLD